MVFEPVPALVLSSLDRIRKASRIKDEKEVKDAQKPTERPMNDGMVFFAAL